MTTLALSFAVGALAGIYGRVSMLCVLIVLQASAISLLSGQIAWLPLIGWIAACLTATQLGYLAAAVVDSEADSLESRTVGCPVFSEEAPTQVRWSAG